MNNFNDIRTVMSPTGGFNTDSQHSVAMRGSGFGI